MCRDAEDVGSLSRFDAGEAPCAESLVCGRRTGYRAPEETLVDKVYQFWDAQSAAKKYASMEPEAYMAELRRLYASKEIATDVQERAMAIDDYESRPTVNEVCTTKSGKPGKCLYASKHSWPEKAEFVCPGRRDITDFILNVKDYTCRMDTSSPVVGCRAASGARTTKIGSLLRTTCTRT